ncbi:two-component system, sensor histidine kinase YesM [Evansella caseinilytica]|uniref:Two-component system, sensor histidine kinase YesM n=1 Tax=Evansella caseinilytica TaxID=1503961 RepID=A0A1H3V1N3_9BACI|nr:histidine kinase [Evansella caseinilytica]SDZ67989.1 two-component system, sensor histidine kinase YesM [Evansella caseinilytica]
MVNKLTIKPFLTRLFEKSIVKKMVIGYFIIIVIPILTSGYFLYKQLSEDMFKELAGDRQEILQQNFNHLEREMIKIEALYQSLQFHSNITDYLQGFYKNDSDSVYHYIKNIKPLLSLIHLESPYVESLRIYSADPDIHFIYPFINPMEMLDISAEAVDAIPPGKGSWKIAGADKENLPVLKYYQHLYNSMYTNSIGVMEVEVKDSLLDYVITIAGKNNFFAIRHGKNIIFHHDESGESNNKINMTAENVDYRESGSDYLGESNTIVNYLYFDRLDLQFLSVEGTESIFSNFKDKRNFLIGTIILLLLLLSAVYSVFAYSFTRRVLKLAKYMRTVDGNNLKQYPGVIQQDEIGYLTASYNVMIRRIDELLTKIQQEERLRKEAQYLALQSQINPHFIYNTLETIRMLAEVNGCGKVSEISYYFGKIMRYSLSSGGSKASLREEVEQVRDFLKIHEIRIGQRFSFAIKTKANIHDFPCPRFLLQPIVENSIIHGVAKRRIPGKVTMVIRETKTQMQVIVKDNGIGIPENRLQQIKTMFLCSEKPAELNNSIALYNINERLKFFYGREADIALYSKYNYGTVCILRLKKPEEHGSGRGKECAKEVDDNENSRS